MLNICTENLVILEFLSKYPEKARSACVEAIMLYGIRTLKTKFPYGLTVPQLLSVSGLPYDSHDRVASSSMNISLAHNRSLDIQQLSDPLKSDEKTERFRASRWEDNPKVKSSKSRSFKVSPGLKEPITASYEAAKSFLDRTGSEMFDRENEVMKIADDFLKNSYAAYLSNGFR
jgi:hypothetical protein